MPHATAAVQVERKNGTLTVAREIEGGAQEVVELTTPCLVAVQTGINQVRYASLKGIMAAKKKPLDVKTRRRPRSRGAGRRERGEDQGREDRAAPEGRPAPRC